MRRNIIDFLRTWKSSTNRKPLIIRGARQVGKTWIMKEFGKEYELCAYINFESTPSLKNLFADDFDIKRLITAFGIQTGINIIPKQTLIILDEIQEAPGAITSLKYFQENGPEYHVISAGSLLGVALSRSASFPVGKIDFLDLYPLDFGEFLEALGEKPLHDLLKSKDWTLIKSFKTRFVELLRQYYYVGGMPEAVMSFKMNTDFTHVRGIQKNILLAYEQDFAKHAPNEIVPRIRMLWNSIPAQLAKENKKFVYGIIRKGARAKEYELALSWLIDCGLIYKVNQVTKPAIPLKAYEDFGAFKLFIVDVGLLSAMTELDPKTLLEGNKIFQEFKGAISEQYVLQQVVAQRQGAIHYWSPVNNKSEVDFLVQISGHVIPVEVKAEENLQAKSLRIYAQKFSPQLAVRTSMADYRQEDWMLNLPLYAVNQLFTLPI